MKKVLLLLTMFLTVGTLQAQEKPNSLDDTIEIVLLKAMEVAEATGEFVMEQAPLLLQEFYMWHTVRHIFLSILFILLMITFHIISKKITKICDNEYLDNPLPLAFDVVAIGFLIASTVQFYYLVFITAAPKLYLIDYFTNTCGC